MHSCRAWIFYIPLDELLLKSFCYRREKPAPLEWSRLDLHRVVGAPDRLALQGEAGRADLLMPNVLLEVGAEHPGGLFVGRKPFSQQIQRCFIVPSFSSWEDRADRPRSSVIRHQLLVLPRGILPLP